MSVVRGKQDKAQGDLLKALMKYEDNAIAYYSDQDYNKRHLTHPDATELESKINATTEKFKNPYLDAFIWLKGEFLDVQGMYEAL